MKYILILIICLTTFTNAKAAVFNNINDELNKETIEEPSAPYKWFKTKDLIINDKELIKKTRTLAKQGDAQAQSLLGTLYLFGYKEITKDCKKAIKWLNVSANQGYDVAQALLGDMYRQKGACLPLDYTESVKWYTLAAKQGNPRGQFGLGNLYYFGLGIKKDYTLSYMWLNLSSAQGNKRSKDFQALVKREMTPEQIAKAEKLSIEWELK